MWWTSLFTLRNLARAVGGVLVSGAVMGIMYLPLGVYTGYFVVLALGVGGLMLVLTTLSDRRTRTEAVRFARTNGWSFEDERSGLFARLSTPPFSAAEASYTAVVTGRFAGFECFDGIYEWRVRLDKDTSISGRHRVAAVRMADELPRVMLIPEGLSSRIAKLFGGRDTDFESSAFNREWRILADDARVAHDILSPQVMERLEAMPVKAPLLFEKGLGVRIDDDSKGIDSLADRLAGIIAVATFLPQHTVEDHGRLANSIGPLPSVATPGALTGGYDPERIARDEEFLRTAKPRKQQKWIDAARSGSLPASPQRASVEFDPDAL